MSDLYRFLEDGDLIEEGDEGVRDDHKGWLPVGPVFVGMPFMSAFKVCRRKVVPAATAREAALRSALAEAREVVVILADLSDYHPEEVALKTRATLARIDAVTMEGGDG